LVSVGAAALLVVLTASILSTVLIGKAYLSESRARKEKDEQLQSARASLSLARNVLSEIFVQFVQMQAHADPQGQKAIEPVITKMLKYYEDMEAQHATDPIVLEEVSRAYLVIAIRVFWDRGEPEQAKALIARAFAIGERLAAEFPDDPECQFQLAAKHFHFAGTLREERDWRAAAEQHRRGLDIVSRLAGLYPTERRFRREQAVGTQLFGELLWDQGGHWQEAVRYHHEAIKLEKQLIKDFPDQPTLEENRMGSDELDLGRTWTGLGLVLSQGLQRQEAEESFHNAIKVFKSLVTEFPLNVEYRDYLASAHNNVGQMLHTFHDLPAAEEHFREVIRIRDPIVKERPGLPFYEFALAAGYHNLGDVLIEKGDVGGAEKLYLLGLDHLPPSVTKVTPEYRWERANSLIRMGDLLTPAGKIADAERTYREGLAICKELAAHIQEPGRYGEGLVNCSFGLAHLLVITGRTQEAKQLCNKVLEIAPKNMAARARMAWLRSTCPDLDLRNKAEALKLAEEAVKSDPIETNWRSLGVAQYRSGDMKGAVAALNKSMQLDKGQDESFNTYFLAMVHWRLGEKEQASKCYDRAVAWMKQNLPHDEELRRFSAEAAVLLSLEDPTRKRKEASSQNN
jgi:tetratricopeptide (TPR) repeat protein